MVWYSAGLQILDSVVTVSELRRPRGTPFPGLLPELFTRNEAASGTPNQQELRASIVTLPFLVLGFR
ncbi:hypothetical protein ANCDUO_11614 [Ancylostoma duodenale]|uniref:Uncharacterized protein n=1 Tax=Ancylostoma duodenale TaxID=51022 RepID=A0A0C2D7R7_9BILA|nr:hypothetical protein ANCDUO_11614 [Ancylostoma duodenale]